MYQFEDFLKTFEPKVYDFASVMTTVEKTQKQFFDLTEKNLKTVMSLAEQNVASWRKVVDSMTSQTSKTFASK